MILMFGRTKTFHALDRAVTVIDIMEIVSQYVGWFIKFFGLNVCTIFYDKWIREQFASSSVKLPGFVYL
jgi:hypothetical protein